jgi:hypothetical protein
LFTITARVLAVRALSKAARSIWNPALEGETTGIARTRLTKPMYSGKYGAKTMTSSPGSRRAPNRIWSAPAAPHVRYTESLPTRIAAVSERCEATASRTSSKPALSIYRCRPGVSSATSFSRAERTAGDGSRSGLPRDRSMRSSSGRTRDAFALEANRLRMRDPDAALSRARREKIALVIPGSVVAPTRAGKRIATNDGATRSNRGLGRRTATHIWRKRWR